MDFSSSARALNSLPRRKPALPNSILFHANVLIDINNSDANIDASVKIIESITFLIHSDEERWEGLAVGLLLSTEILANAITLSRNGNVAVYIDGPRVPDEEKMTENDSLTNRFYFTTELISQLATRLHNATLENLEHNEPRIRTLVAKAVGSHATWSVGLGSNNKISERHRLERNTIHSQIIVSVNEHILEGRSDTDKYSKSSMGALDDTTGWRALETNWQCLACWIASLGSNYYEQVDNDCKDGDGLDLLLQNLEYSAVTHVNRHVRAAAIVVLEQLIVAAGNNEAYWPFLQSGNLRKTSVNILKAGLADNWSQVRMAASVLNRVFWSTLQEKCQFSFQNLKLLYPTLVPRMCLNRFYLAQGVKLYSHQTWKVVFPDNGVEVVSLTIAPIVRYYVKMCDADNHVVREASCQAVAELAVKIGMDERYAKFLQLHVVILLQALLMCFHDESWPVRDEACLACGIFCRAYPEECKSELETLWTRWTEQLTDQIWSVREGAAVALGQAYQAYGQDFFNRLMIFIKENLPAAKKQPKMTMQEYKALQNNMEAHTENQLYSCGSLAPKLRKAGAGRIGCTNCLINRPKQPWEATDGCLYLLRELIEICNQPDSIHVDPLTDDILLKLMEEVIDICRVSHFPQADELRATLWNQLPRMMLAIGKIRCKRLYLEVFLDLLMETIESRTASAICKHAAAACAYDLSALVGPNILRGRLYDGRQKESLDSVLREQQLEEQKCGHMKDNQQSQPSPFEPPGLFDTQYTTEMQPSSPLELVAKKTQHPGVYGSINI